MLLNGIISPLVASDKFKRFFATCRTWPQVDNYSDEPPNTARERLIGLTNRVIGGMLIHTSRMQTDKCEDSRFAKIENNCASGISTQPYGVDPVFVMGSTLFDPDLDNEKSLVTFYNCSEIPEPERVYNIDDPYSKSGATVNRPPYCANLYNMRDVPFGFHSHELEGKTSGFPVWIDINLSEDQAQYWYRYLEEGLMLDVLTREVTVDLVTYNAELRMFSSVFVRFRFTDGGAIAVTYKLHTIRVELYSGRKDYVRLCLELIFALCVLTTAVYQLKVRIVLRWNAVRLSEHADMYYTMAHFFAASNLLQMCEWLHCRPSCSQAVRTDFSQRGPHHISCSAACMTLHLKLAASHRASTWRMPRPAAPSPTSPPAGPGSASARPRS